MQEIQRGEQGSGEGAQGVGVRWQYLIEPQGRNGMLVGVTEGELNRRGAEGWELCACDFGCFIYKRRINGPSEAARLQGDAFGGGR